MRRREFIAGLGGAAAWPFAARAQQQVMPVIGFFHWGSLGQGGNDVAALRQGLAETGYIEGQNLAVESRWAEGHYNRLPGLAAELVRRQVAVIVAAGTADPAIAAKAATATIPIVFANGSDPVKDSLVVSFNRPGGNITGMTFIPTELAGKRLDLLHTMIPQTTTVAYLSGGPGLSSQADEVTDVLAAGRALGLKVIVTEARSERDIEAAFATVVQHEAGALIVGVAPHLTFNSYKIVALAARHKIPAIYPWPNYAFRGGLMSYGADLSASFRQLGVDYVAPILKGAKPADLPVQRPTKFKLIINLKTAKTLGLTIPRNLLALADEVIE